MKSDRAIPIIPAYPAMATGPSGLEPRQPLVLPGLFAVGISDSNTPSVDDAEEQYWRENHFTQPYGRDGDYAVYEAAYRVGYEGFRNYEAGASFADAEAELRNQYEALPSGLPWGQARRAASAAWQRAYEHHVNPNFDAE